MTTTETPPVALPRSRRRRNILWYLCGLSVIVIATAVWLHVGPSVAPAPKPQTVPDPLAVATAPLGVTVPQVVPPTVTADPVIPALADGCLGGSDPYTAILPAQQAASLDDLGAAAFARSVMRYTTVTPYPTDGTAVLPQVFVDPGPILAHVATLGVPEQMTSQYLSTDSVYRITAAGADRTVTVVLQVRRSTSTTSEDQILTGTWVLTPVDGHWWIKAITADSGSVGTDPGPALPYFDAC